MTRLTEKQIARLLAARATPEQPAGLADRIKAEIPGSIRLDRQTFRPGRRWLMPPLIEGLHPSWLAAASVLLVAGVGMVAARIIPSQPDDVWKWMALSGVVHIDDIVVTAPAPAKSGTVAIVATPPAGALGLRRVSDSREPAPAKTVAATRAGVPEQAASAAISEAAGRASLRALPRDEHSVRSEPGGSKPGEKRATVAAGNTSGVGVTSRQGRIAEEAGVAGGAPNISAPAQAAAPLDRSRRDQISDSIGSRENAVTVSVLDEAGRPCERVTVTLERLGQDAFWRRTARTGADGTAMFRGVPPASYRALAASPAIAPGQVVVNVGSDRAPTRVELHVRALPRH